MQYDCRLWFEWIDSDSNPSDGLSRAGLADEWTRAQGFELLEELPPFTWDELSRIAGDDVLSNFLDIGVFS